MRLAHPLSLPALLLLTVVLSVSAHASVIYSTFGTGETYTSGDGIWVGTTNLRSQWAAMQFTSSGDATVAQIDLALQANETWVVTITLNSSDVDGNLDAVLLSWTTTLTTQSTQIVSLTPTTSVQLTDGDTYWITVSCSSGNGTWLYGDPGVNGLVYLVMQDGSASGPGTQGAFEVLGDSATPEPAGALLSATGLGLLGLWRRRQSRAR